MKEDSLNKLEEILSAAERIVEESDPQAIIEFEPSGEVPEGSVLNMIELEHNQELMYDFFYKKIQRFLSTILPHDETITKVIRNLNATILSKHTKTNITSGRRGGDSRQASVDDYKNLMDAYEEWANQDPDNLLGLATILLAKGKELGIIEQDLELQDFVPSK